MDPMKKLIDLTPEEVRQLICLKIVMLTDLDDENSSEDNYGDVCGLIALMGNYSERQTLGIYREAVERAFDYYGFDRGAREFAEDAGVSIEELPHQTHELQFDYK